MAAWCNINFAYYSSNPLFYAHHLYVNGEEVKDLVIPNSVTSIGEYAFSSCSGLISVTIPNSVTSIGSSAFSGCSGLISVTIPNSVTSIGESGFRNCSGLTSVTIGDSVTSIGEYAFSGCSGLISVTIPNSVTSIGESAFSDCSGLTSVTIGNGVTSIGGRAFLGCHFIKENFVNNSLLSAEEEYYWGAGVHDYETNDGLLIDSTCVVFCRKYADVVTIPNSVTSIGHNAFYGCSGLTSVTIPNSVETIGSFAFARCSEILDVYCYAENVPNADDFAFETDIENATLHVPAVSVESYKATAPWNRFGKIVALTEEETGIDELKSENGKVKTAVYDLSGRRVQKAHKGIYIQNSKVMIQ